MHIFNFVRRISPNARQTTAACCLRGYSKPENACLGVIMVPRRKMFQNFWKKAPSLPQSGELSEKPAHSGNIWPFVSLPVFWKE